MEVKSKLGKLALWYDYTIVCDDIRLSNENHKVELTNPVEYTKEDLLKKYTGNEVVIKWEHTYTEQGEPAMAVVLEEGE